MNAEEILVMAGPFALWAILGLASRLWDIRYTCQHDWIAASATGMSAGWHLVRCTKCGKEDIDV